MPPTHTVLPAANRRVFLRQSGLGLGGAALAGLLARSGSGQTAPGLLAGPHHPPRARRMISLVMAGGPASQDLFDYKPLLNERHGSELPDSVRGGQRLTGMSSQQSSLPLAGSAFQFARHGKSGAWVSELLPHTAKVATLTRDQLRGSSGGAPTDSATLTRQRPMPRSSGAYSSG